MVTRVIKKIAHMLKNINPWVKLILGVSAFASAIVIAFIAAFMPPQGIIDNSILWFTAQLLVFTATFLGVKMPEFPWKKSEK